uniref:hypothetical protein n=1 Tax=Halorubrum lacusprofundi TaxID=2247 RepID=UPI00373FD337
MRYFRCIADRASQELRKAGFVPNGHGPLVRRECWQKRLATSQAHLQRTLRPPSLP